MHAKEVAIIAGMLAGEIGANKELAKRAAVLHDIGKGAETDSDQTTQKWEWTCTKNGRDPRVINNRCPPQ